MNQDKSTDKQKRPLMVDWFSPSQLFSTGISTLVSTMMGSQIDARRLLAREGATDDCVIDHSKPDSQARRWDGEFTFAYMADTGDGWDATYSMARLLNAPSLAVPNIEQGEIEELRAADIVILGGDEIYPIASKKLYAERLMSPFQQAADDTHGIIDESAPRRQIYLLPGNHDWYDCLGSFSRAFLATGKSPKLVTKRLGEYETRQVRSYFVLELPDNWEIWGVDAQLGEDLDNAQMNFFTEHAETINPDTKIVLCAAAPLVVFGRKVDQTQPELASGLNSIIKLAHDKGARVAAQLAGDIHNYQHYVVREEAENCDHVEPYTRHQIVSGGGGAFLHPNHGFYSGPDHVKPTKLYPDMATSESLSAGVLRFVLDHKAMCCLIGILYLFFFWSRGIAGAEWLTMADGLSPAQRLLETLSAALTMPFKYPWTFLVGCCVVFGASRFAGKNLNGKSMWWWGLLHGICHCVLALGCWLLAEACYDEALQRFSTNPPEFVELIVTRVLVFLLGAILGGTLFAAYMWASLRFLAIHHNETFSALACADYKHFLHVTVHPRNEANGETGGLIVRVVGVEKTASESERQPVQTHLVEKFVIR